MLLVDVTVFNTGGAANSGSGSRTSSAGGVCALDDRSGESRAYIDGQVLFHCLGSNYVGKRRICDISEHAALAVNAYLTRTLHMNCWANPCS